MGHGLGRHGTEADQLHAQRAARVHTFTLLSDARARCIGSIGHIE